MAVRAGFSLRRVVGAIAFSTAFNSVIFARLFGPLATKPPDFVELTFDQPDSDAPPAVDPAGSAQTRLRAGSKRPPVKPIPSALKPQEMAVLPPPPPPPPPAPSGVGGNQLKLKTD